MVLMLGPIVSCLLRVATIGGGSMVDRTMALQSINDIVSILERTLILKWVHKKQKEAAAITTQKIINHHE